MSSAMLSRGISRVRLLPLLPYKQKVDKAIAKAVERMAQPFLLRDAVEYSLVGDAKSLRPILAMLIAEALEQGLDITHAALSIEFFHTASLILDDLPSMDDDDLRRGKPSLHIAFDEPSALLASNALIFEAFYQIHLAAEEMAKSPKGAPLADTARRIALERASHNAGIRGATTGQYFDLFPPSFSKESCEEVMRLKTVTFFEGAFTFGWVFGGGDPERVDEVSTLAAHFGMAFQIADDLDDAEQDAKKGGRLNLANAIGIERASEQLNQELDAFESLRDRLNLRSEMLDLVYSMMSGRG